MTKLDDINRLAEIKSIMKLLDEEAKPIQARLVADPDCPKKIATEYGPLVLGTRTTYQVGDKDKVVDRIGMSNFIAACSITLSAVGKVCGTEATDDLLAQKVFTVKSVSRYFTLRRS